MHTNSMKRLKTLGALAALIFTLGNSAQAESVTINIGYGMPGSSIYSISSGEATASLSANGVQIMYDNNNVHGPAQIGLPLNGTAGTQCLAAAREAMHQANLRKALRLKGHIDFSLIGNGTVSNDDGEFIIALGSVISCSVQ